MKSSVVKRSIVLCGHKTSVSLEDAFWSALKTIAAGLNMTLSELIETIDTKREHANLSSAIRLFVLEFYRNQFIARMGVENLTPSTTLTPDQIPPVPDTKVRSLERSVA
jgi:predicted DNA-binding ribbon-helix-helix protein